MKNNPSIDVLSDWKETYIRLIQSSRTDHADDLKRLAAAIAADELVAVSLPGNWESKAQSAYQSHMRALGQEPEKNINFTTIVKYGLAQVVYTEAKESHVFERDVSSSKNLNEAIESVQKNKNPDFESLQTLFLTFQNSAQQFANGKMPDEILNVGSFVKERHKEAVEAKEHRDYVREITDESMAAKAKEGLAAAKESIAQKLGIPLLDKFAGHHEHPSHAIVDTNSDIYKRMKVLDNRFSFGSFAVPLSVAAIGLGAVSTPIVAAIAATGVSIKVVLDLSKPPKSMSKFYDRDGNPQTNLFATEASGASPKEMAKTWTSYMNKSPQKGLLMNARLLQQDSESLQLIFHRAHTLMHAKPGQASSGKTLGVVAALDRAIDEMCDENPHIKAKSSLTHAVKVVSVRAVIASTAAIGSFFGGHSLEPLLPGALHLIADPAAEAGMEATSSVSKAILDTPRSVGIPTNKLQAFTDRKSEPVEPKALPTYS